MVKQLIAIYWLIQDYLEELSHDDICELAEQCDVCIQTLYNWRDSHVVQPIERTFFSVGANLGYF